MAFEMRSGRSLGMVCCLYVAIIAFVVTVFFGKQFFTQTSAFLLTRSGDDEEESVDWSVCGG